MLGSATPEQLITYKAYYDTLSNIWKSTPTSKDDERRIMTNLFNVRDAINNLKNELSTIEYGSQSGGMGL